MKRSHLMQRRGRARYDFQRVQRPMAANKNGPLGRPFSVSVFCVTLFLSVVFALSYLYQKGLL